MTRKRKILFVGDSPEQSSPSRTLGDALREYGIEYSISTGEELGPIGAWKKLVRKFDLIIVVCYDGPKPIRLKRLAAARAIGIPLLRWWVGSDVWNILNDMEMQQGAKKLTSISHASIAVAPHLVDELTTIGMSAEYVPSVLNSNYSNIEIASELPHGVLVYMPEHRREFYGLSLLQSIVRKFPEVPFYIVGDHDSPLAQFKNVTTFGWVDEMNSIWQSCGLLLRMTRHDGMPRMILEALLRGRYVIFSGSLGGCWHAENESDVAELVERFQHTNCVNLKGRDFAIELMQQNPAEIFASRIHSICESNENREKSFVAERWRAIQLLGKLTTTQLIPRPIRRSFRRSQTTNSQKTGIQPLSIKSP